jgi:hypothetical protein
VLNNGKRMQFVRVLHLLLDTAGSIRGHGERNRAVEG